MKELKNILRTGKKYKFFILEKQIGHGVLDAIITNGEQVFLQVTGTGGLFGCLNSREQYLIPLNNITRIRGA